MIRLHGLLRLSSLFVAVATASAAHALGVGEVNLNSRLNQPLDAKIALFEADGLDSEEVIVKLASPEAFERVGLDRPYFLTDLKFSSRLQGAQGNIIVTSSKPIREPYLSFLIEVTWPNGRMLREYTLLLDPPVYAPTPQQSVASTPAQTQKAAPVQGTATAATTGQPEPVQQPPRAAEPAPTGTGLRPATPRPGQTATGLRPATPRPEQAAASSGVLPDGQYRIQNNDTLWEIASNFSPSGSRVQQTMLAIQDLNPDAFINNNINLLKKGQVLRLPDEQQINRRSAAEAFRLVAEQNDAWRESRRNREQQRQVDATGGGTAGGSRQTDSVDNLRLVSSASSGGTSALNERLIEAQEKLDSSLRESADLRSRVSDLEGQLEKLQRLVELKDANLARLQEQLAGSGEAVTVQDMPDVSSTAEPLNESVLPDEDVSFGEETPFEDATSFDDTTTRAIPEQPPIVNEINSDISGESPWWERALDNPMLVWGAGGAGLLLLLLLMVKSRRNARKWDERELETEYGAEETLHGGDFATSLAVPDSTFNDLQVEKPLKSKQERALSDFDAKTGNDVNLSLKADNLEGFSSKSEPLGLDDFADFDLKFTDTSKKEQAPAAPLDFSKEADFDKQGHAPTNASSLQVSDKVDEFDFTTEDESFPSSLGDFELDDKTQAAGADAAPDLLDDLDFTELDGTPPPPPVQALTEPPRDKPKQAEAFKATDDDFDFLNGTDETETKLDLARAYIDMGDMEGARDILDEVMNEGSDSQRSEAKGLMTSLA